MEEENIKQNPNFEVSQLRYLLLKEERDNEKLKYSQRLLKIIQDEEMGPYYEYLVANNLLPHDANLQRELQEKNTAKLQQLEDKLKDAEQNLGENEIREAYLSKAEYLCQIGNKDKSIFAYRQTSEKTVALGQRLDIVFCLIRIGFFWSDYDLISRNIEKARSLLEEGGDWDRRNRLKVYEGVWNMVVRRFEKAATLFLETLSTFTSYELFPYQTFIYYTVLMCVVSVDRNTLRKKVINAPEILTVLPEQKSLGNFLNSLYECNYSLFFRSLGEILENSKHFWLFDGHSRYYGREMRILGYSQLLESYRSVQIESMAQAFGVSVQFIDKELSRFIAAGRLHCKIDKVSGIVETNRPDAKNAQYQSTIKQGDQLLNRVQKLARLVY